MHSPAPPLATPWDSRSAAPTLRRKSSLRKECRRAAATPQAGTEFPQERAPDQTPRAPLQNRSEAVEQTFSVPPDPRATMPRGGRCPLETPDVAALIHPKPIATDQQDSQSRYMQLVSSLRIYSAA